MQFPGLPSTIRVMIISVATLWVVAPLSMMLLGNWGIVISVSIFIVANIVFAKPSKPRVVDWNTYDKPE